MKKNIYIGIGSNLGDPLKNCHKALDRIRNIPECEVSRVSRFYLSEPVGVDGQEWYVNGVAMLKCTLEPAGLMRALLDIESEMGRIREKKWESRVIDLDILLYGMEIINADDLTIPHPLMHKRRFVLAPMMDLAPDLIHPVKDQCISELLENIDIHEQKIQVLGDD